MQCLLVENQHSTLIHKGDVSLAKLLREPLHMPKEQVPQWIFGSLVEGHITRCNAAVGMIHALILDFDHQIKVHDFCIKSKSFQWALHTTSRHTQAEHHFRVIIPLLVPVEAAWLREPSTKAALLEVWPDLDPSSVVNWHKLPVLPADPADYYFHVQKGMLFDMHDIAARAYVLKQEAEARQQKMQRQLEAEREARRTIPPEQEQAMRDGLWKWYLETHVEGWLNSIAWGCDGQGRYDALLHQIGKWKRYCEINDFDIDEIADIARYAVSEPQHIKLIDRLLK